MARRPSNYPTELELEIMKIVWRDQPCSVRHVRQQLAEFRDLAHNSVMTMMAIMKDKGYLKRRKQGRGYIYQPKVTQKEITRGMLGDLVDRAFHGSSMAAVIHLLETGDFDEKGLAELRNLIQQKEKGEKS